MRCTNPYEALEKVRSFATGHFVNYEKRNRPGRSANNSCQISQLRVTVRALCSLDRTVRGPNDHDDKLDWELVENSDAYLVA
jgi:hypothetical protein